jgi:hypothetical protein
MRIGALVSLATLAQIGCGSTPAECHCPAGITHLALPREISSVVTKVSGDSCASAGDSQDGTVLLTASTATPCHVTIDLADGTELTTTVTFTSVGGCCASEYVGTDSSPFEHADGGSASN